MSFFFDYIYYRITQFYFKWDGRRGITALASICLIELMLLIDILLLYLKVVNGTTKRQAHPIEQWLFVAFYIIIYIYNNKKYGDNYNKYRYYWKDEPPGKRFYKGFFVILALVTPVAVAFCIYFF